MSAKTHLFERATSFVARLFPDTKRRSSNRKQYQHQPSAMMERLESREMLSATLTTLASFDGLNGAAPVGSLLLSGNTFYGTTFFGGTYGDGTVYSVPVSGGTPTVLASFDGTNGTNPCGSLILSDGTLYGTTVGGGANGAGTVFSLPVSGGTLTTLVSLNWPIGAGPSDALILSGSTIYGTTEAGGANGFGTVFSLPISGGTPTTLASFNGTDGVGPVASLILSGSTLYGTTEVGGANGAGTVFSLPISGGTPTTLASFSGTNGAVPIASLILSGSTLYGTTVEGGSNGGGTVFSLPISGGPPTTLASFNWANGTGPFASLTLSGSTLYGTTSFGGASGEGTVFSLPVGGGTPNTLVSFSDTYRLYPPHTSSLTLSGNTFYGTTASGGTNGAGTVFSLTLTGVGVPTQLAFDQQPTNVAGAGTILTPAVTVYVEDENGSLVTTDNSNVTLSITSGPGGATLNGTVTVQAVNGVATFPNLSLSQIGTYTLSATDGSLASATSTSFNVANINKITPTLTWPAPSAITYGTALSATQLDATSGGIPGTFQYTPSLGTVLHVGSNQTLSVTFTPADTNNYTTVSDTVLITVNKATPTISWPTPTAIAFGTALSVAQLDATSGGIQGTFQYTPALGTKLNVGSNQTLSVTFTPMDTIDYNIASASTQITVNKAAPTISWPTPAAITYGTALSATQLNATANVPGTFVYTPALGTVLHAGANQTLSVVFTPTDTTDYSVVSRTTSITVDKITSVVTWNAPTAITYGTALSTTQLNATASVPGTFIYTPALGTVMHAGANQTLNVVFTPTNSTDYTIVNSTTSITVNKVTSVVTWPTPTAITYGTALSGTQLNATANVAGTFAYSSTLGTILYAGANQVLSAVFTPTDTTDYTTVNVSTLITVNKATPVVSWVAPVAITYGTALSASQLDATSQIPGLFEYVQPVGTVLGAGVDQPLSVVFIPTDTDDYTTANASTLITVNKAKPVVIWEPPANITYGTALSDAQLDATTNSVPGTYVYTPASGTLLHAGASQTLSVLFTPTDTINYTTANGSVQITVNQATPVVTWATPADITYGTALSATQLDASADVPGSYVYTPAVGKVLGVGANQNLNMVFKPTDSANYTTANGSTVLTVNQATTTTAVTAGSSSSSMGNSVTFTATVSSAPGSGAAPTGTVQFLIDGNNVGNPVTLTSNNIATYTTKIPSPGSHTVRAIYFGDDNFIGSTSPTIAQTITAPLGDKVKKFSYTQTDGTKVSITLTGLTAQVLLHGSSLVLSTVITGITTITGSVDSIDIAIDPASGAPVAGTLTFTTTKPTATSNLPGNGVAKVGSITGQSLSTLAAGSVDLIGAGLNFSESIGTTTLHDLTNGADITYSGFTTKPLTMSYQIINSGSTIRTNSAIGTFKANSVAPGSEIDAPWLATLITTALTARSLTGDFGATLNLTGVGTKGQQNTTLGTMTIAGAISNAHIHSAGNIGTVTAGSMINSELYAGVNTINNALPMNASELAMNASIASLTIKGIAGTNAFVNSNIAAATLTMVSLKDAQLNNSGTHFGISARTIKALTLTQGKTKYTWSPTSTAKWIATPVDLTVLDV